jgi:hypothetical protein
MRSLFLLPLASLLLTPPACLAQSPSKSPVIVELFTSEGCSSCPPADALLVELEQSNSEKGAEVIALGEHVDYWNHDGWTDRFSSSAFTQRQQDYVGRFRLDSPYTPQFVIDGRLQLVGNDRSGVDRFIRAAEAEAKPAQVSLSWEAVDRLQVRVELPASSKAQVVLAITEDGLTSNVRDGENRGRTLHHAAVVRYFHQLGAAKNGKFERSVALHRGADWDPSKLKAVVFVQQPQEGPILGAVSIPFSR